MWKHARFCPSCSAPLAPGEAFGRQRLVCGACSFVLFANPVGASAAVVIDRERRLLLVRRAIEPFSGRWALPAGYQEIDESPAGTAERETEEETGVTVRTIALLDLVFVPDDPRKAANVALYLAVPVAGEPRGRDDALDAAWFPIASVPEDLAFASTRSVLERLAAPSHEARGWWASWERAIAALGHSGAP